MRKGGWWWSDEQQQHLASNLLSPSKTLAPIVNPVLTQTKKLEQIFSLAFLWNQYLCYILP